MRRTMRGALDGAVRDPAGVVEDDIAVEDDIHAGVTTTENPAEWRMKIEQQYRGSFKGLGNSSSGRYHVHLAVWSCVHVPFCNTLNFSNEPGRGEGRCVSLD